MSRRFSLDPCCMQSIDRTKLSLSPVNWTAFFSSFCRVFHYFNYFVEMLKSFSSRVTERTIDDFERQSTSCTDHVSTTTQSDWAIVRFIYLSSSCILLRHVLLICAICASDEQHQKNLCKSNGHSMEQGKTNGLLAITSYSGAQTDQSTHNKLRSKTHCWTFEWYNESTDFVIFLVERQRKKPTKS